ncbi:IS630 transposase-related protein [Pseudoalteromonas sp. NBT06-2]|nr:IS630 transposase-related protein [Pseudoalteromonas sp. NBT06-2]
MDMQVLEKDVQSHPDDYQWERAKRLGVCQPAIYHTLKRTNINFKKH